MEPGSSRNRWNLVIGTLGTPAASPSGRISPAAAEDAGPRGGRKHSTVAIRFLLVHGAWHGAGHWAMLGAALTRRGHDVCAVDLPGHGMSARFPASYFDAEQRNLAHDVSPVSHVTLDTAAQSVVAALETLHRRRDGRRCVVLVAHSMGGAVATRAVQAVPHLVDHVVYVSAFVPTRLGSAGAYLALPEAASASGAGLYLGDPAETGAVRINPRSTDPAYLEELRSTYSTGCPRPSTWPTRTRSPRTSRWASSPARWPRPRTVGAPCPGPMCGVCGTGPCRRRCRTG
ncbi:alpha/beta hydrolase [Streptomyces malaysiensis]|uniref:alpha/beta hydrolase n=1 Tax=Streptomyces malaysiensis TaxID=92644 RepID=UPI0035584F1F